MAHILVAQEEPHLSKMLVEVLSVEGHSVTRVNSGEHMYQALLATPQPFVVLYYTTLLYRFWDSPADDEGQRDSAAEAQLPEHPWQAMLRQVDVFRCHRFIETRAWAFSPPEDMRPFYDQLGVTILMMPLDIEHLVSVVADAARQSA